VLVPVELGSVEGVCGVVFMSDPGVVDVVCAVASTAARHIDPVNVIKRFIVFSSMSRLK
jgi:hypothetical protein